MASNIVGRVTQVMGAVVDVQFDGDLPYIQNALHSKIEDRTLVVFQPSPRSSASITRSRATHRSVSSGGTKQDLGEVRLSCCFGARRARLPRASLIRFDPFISN